MAMPLVTYACDLTGLIETAMTMAEMPMNGDESDCPCEGPLRDLCGSSASDCAAVVDCHGESFDADACCSSHPEMDDAIASASAKPDVQPAVTAILPDLPLREADSTPVNGPTHQRAPPQRIKAPVHILHSSLLL